MEDYQTVNRVGWDERVPAHAASPDYQVERFAEDPGFLSSVVRFDLPRLGAISGLRGVHLQCHIGTEPGQVESDDTAEETRILGEPLHLVVRGCDVSRDALIPAGPVDYPVILHVSTVPHAGQS